MGSRQCQGGGGACNYKDICLKGPWVDVFWYYNNVPQFPFISQKNLCIIMYIDSNRYFAQIPCNVQAKELSLCPCDTHISEHHGHSRLVSLLCWHIKPMLTLRYMLVPLSTNDKTMFPGRGVPWVCLLLISHACRHT